MEAGVTYEFTNDLKGIEMSFSTTGRNTFGTELGTNVATGIDIDFSSINVAVNATSEIVGLRVDMGATSRNRKRHAALFNNGNVGINVSDPSVALEVEWND